MKIVTLPEKTSKGEIRVEEIKNVKLRVDADQKPIPVEFKIPATNFKFPQFENLAEAITDADGEEKLLAYVNACFASDAVTAAKNQIRNATTATDKENYSDVVTSALKVAETYTLNQPESLSTKDKANAFDELATLAKGDIDKDELIKRLLALAGK